MKKCLLINCMIGDGRIRLKKCWNSNPYRVHIKELHCLLYFACMLSCFSRVQLFATLWTVACQAPLSMGFSRQESWSGLPCPLAGTLTQVSNSHLLHLPHWQAGSLTLAPLGSPFYILFRIYLSWGSQRVLFWDWLWMHPCTHLFIHVYLRVPFLAWHWTNT